MTLKEMETDAGEIRCDNQHRWQAIHSDSASGVANMANCLAPKKTTATAAHPATFLVKESAACNCARRNGHSRLEALSTAFWS
jgi:hypothetical protein